tara:strand:+ start:635 stop:940 length:306 start_codon:yes stop_codon:yes gene_type:complete
MKETRMKYEIGDLVKIEDRYNLDDSHPYAGEYPSTYTPKKKLPAYGLVVGKTVAWHEAYEDDDHAGTRYWDNVSYSPYHVMLLGVTQVMEWVSPEFMELIS